MIRWLSVRLSCLKVKYWVRATSFVEWIQRFSVEETTFAEQDKTFCKNCSLIIIETRSSQSFLSYNNSRKHFSMHAETTQSTKTIINDWKWVYCNFLSTSVCKHNFYGVLELTELYARMIKEKKDFCAFSVIFTASIKRSSWSGVIMMQLLLNLSLDLARFVIIEEYCVIFNQLL